MAEPLSETQRKISLFENTEREKAEKEERDRKRALFARKLSKFGENAELNGDNNVNVGKETVGAKVKMFTEAPGSEERRKEAERRRSEFRRKLSAFSGEKADDDEGQTTAVVSTRRVSETARIFSGAGNGEDPDEAERQRCHEEDRQRKAEQFRAKREIFST